MAPPSKREKLKHESTQTTGAQAAPSISSNTKSLPAELRLKILNHLAGSLPSHLPHEAYRDMQDVDEEEKIAVQTFVAIMKSNREFAQEAAEVIFENTLASFKCVPDVVSCTRDYGFVGLGKLWSSNTSINKGRRYLRNARHIHLMLPELIMLGVDGSTLRKNATLYLTEREFGINFIEDIVKIDVPMAQLYARCIMNNAQHSTYGSEHFKLLLEPFMASIPAGLRSRSGIPQILASFS